MASSCSFDPDAIATSIASAIKNDLQRINFDTILDPDATRFFQNQITSSVLKKFDSQKNDVDTLELTAFALFESINHGTKQPDFSQVVLTQGLLTYTVSDILSLMRSWVSFILGDFHLDEFLLNCKHSSGVSRGVSYSDTSLTAKWKLPLTGTKRSLDFLRNCYFQYDFSLKGAVIGNRRGIPSLDGWTEVKEGSKATTVPKQSDKRRMIAIEPTVNMFFQQGLMSVMYDRLADFGYDVTRLPEIHKKLARRASIDGGLSTIDYSSASDSVSLWLVREIFPRDWFFYLDMFRSPTIEILGDVLPLHVYATMGNATTFPVESVVFLSLMFAIGQIRHDNIRPGFPKRLIANLGLRTIINPGSFTVFGDDCILPTNISSDFIRLSSLIGFSVNTEKSFTDGRFRESCGGDYYRGCDVRGVYLRTPVNNKLSTLEPWLYTIVNNVIMKYITYFGRLTYVYEKDFFRVVFAIFRRHKLRIKLVPPNFPDDSGVRWFKDLERLLKIYQVPLSPIHIGDHGTLSFYYCKWSYPQTLPANEDILYYSELKKKFLRGHVISKFDITRLSFRSPKRRRGTYVVARGLSSFWEFIPTRSFSSFN